MKAKINGKQVSFKSKNTILDVAKSQGINIPTLCYMDACNEVGYCRLCVVEVEGQKDLVSSCDTPMKKGMNIKTNSKRVRDSRKSILRLLSSKHRFDCFNCPKEKECRFYDLLKSHEIDFDDFNKSSGRKKGFIEGIGITQDLSKCVLCKKCVSVCSQYADSKVLKFRDDIGYDPVVSPTPGVDFTNGACTYCGLCVQVCPTGTLQVKSDLDKFEQMLESNDVVVAQLSKLSVAVIHEEFGKPSNNNLKRTLSILDKLGVNFVLDADFGLDILIDAQSRELIENLKGRKYPMFTSNSPAWIRYVEQFKPEFIENLSKYKSGHIIGGIIAKEQYTTQLVIKNEQIKVVSILPDTAAKYEIEREELKGAVDLVITTSELVRLAKRRQFKFEDSELQNLKKLVPFREWSNPSVLEGVIYNLTAKTLNFQPIKHFPDLLESATKIDGVKVNVIKTTGGIGAKQLFKYLESTSKTYHYIEVDGVYGGELNGGGQPQHKSDFREIHAKRNEYSSKWISSPRVIESYEIDFEKIETKFSRKIFTRE